MNLARLVTQREATALRDCAKSEHAPLSTFLGEQERIHLGYVELTPFRLVVKHGVDMRSEFTEIARMRLGLWPLVYFKLGPRCRLCGQRIADGDKALGFAFTPDGGNQRERVAYIHLGECVPYDPL